MLRRTTLLRSSPLRLATLVLPGLLACQATPSGGGNETPSNTGGSSGTGGRSAGSGGSPSASGGSPGSGGTVAGSGGGSAQGGTTGSGGTTTGTGGTTAGTGGTTTAPDGGGSSDGPATSMPPEKGELGQPNFPGWKYTKPIKLDTSAGGANVAGAVMNFPIAVRLNAQNFAEGFGQARPNGEDLRFGTSDGTPLQYEREVYDKGGQIAVFWVKVASIAGNDANQSINMYWGNATAGDASDSKKVFDTAAGYVGVWHLGDEGGAAAGGYKDSTGSEAHATGVNTEPATRAAGLIGNGVLLVNAKEQWIKVEDKAPLFKLKDMTVAIWGKANSFPGKSGPGGYDTILSKGEEWTVQKFSFNKVFEACFDGGGGGCAIGKTQINTGAWYRHTVVVSGGKSSYYINGARDAGSGGTSKDRAKPLAIGNQSQYIGNAKEKRSWDGLLDEVVYISGVRDDNWIKLDFESQKEGSTFLKFGATATR